jgi:hypothetical protein
MIPHVKRVSWLKDYQLELELDDGVVKTVDLSKELHGQVFEPLTDLEFFKRVAVNDETRTIEWPNGADFAPEFFVRDR